MYWVRGTFANVAQTQGGQAHPVPEIVAQEFIFKEIQVPSGQASNAGQRQMAFLVVLADSATNLPFPSVVILIPPQSAVFGVRVFASE